MVQHHVTAQCIFVSRNVPRKRLTGRKGRSLKLATEDPEKVGKTSKGKSDETNRFTKINDVELPNDGSVLDKHVVPSDIILSKTQTESPGRILAEKGPLAPCGSESTRTWSLFL